jgi:hypothetical protein
MKVGRWKLAALAALTISMIGVADLRPSFAQTSPRGITLYEDLKTGALYRKPGRGRVAVTLGFDEAPPPAAAVQEQVQREVKKSNDELRAEFIANQQTLIKENNDLKQRVSAIEPAWKEYLGNFRDRFHVGALVYGDYQMYTHTGWGPQYLENVNPPGPGNNLYNSFDITRAYLNFYFNPTSDWQLRITPDVYRTQGTATPTSTSRTTQVSSNLTGDLSYRLKYAYVEYNKILDWAGSATKGTTIQFGALPNVFIPWEEDLSDFRYVTLPPWNFLGLSSGQNGIQIQGPIKSGEKTYVDYGFGAYNNSKFSQFEQSNTKQVMARGTIYPFGANWRFQGLGATMFYDYGYGNSSPDNGSVNSGFGPCSTCFGHVNNSHLMRLAALLHYTTEEWGIAGEYDQGHNAFNGSNLFSASGPSVFFTPPATASAAGGTSSTYSVQYYNFSAMTAALQNNSRTVQQGFDFFGHVHIPETRFTLLGLFQYFQPNTHVNTNPLDFMRYMVGVEYRFNEFVRLAVDTQDTLFFHSQTPFPTSEANHFAKLFVPIKNTNAGGAPFQPPTSIIDPVPRDTHSVQLNLEFSF